MSFASGMGACSGCRWRLAAHRSRRGEPRERLRRVAAGGLLVLLISGDLPGGTAKFIEQKRWYHHVYESVIPQKDYPVET